MITRRKPHSEKAVVCNMYKNEVAAPYDRGLLLFLYPSNLRTSKIP
ncbi:hypothetical protein SAMN06295960_2044 [Paenibacillus aquistagni]|uniref:Uncharacterized protein n=1 Tax=Paenibacillus aquistagni TaxID=1852522 RepID=A0A1X7K4B5_9BACL|nr:hypothetical protein SAMN06295960_2044 [Paenibacillus aquistagni]